jgi:hypothetical protein
MTIKIKRLDRHGMIAGIIDDLNKVSLLDKHLPQDDKQEITPGEAIKGMIMITLIPSTIKLEKTLISDALAVQQ